MSKVSLDMMRDSGSKVLVADPTSVIGKLVTRKLVEKNIPTRILLDHGASLSEWEGVNVEIVRGSVYQEDELEAAMQSCHCCVYCSRTERQTSPVDLIYKMWDPRNVFLGAWGPSKPKVIPEDWPTERMSILDPATDPAHPWNDGFYTSCNMRDVALKCGCRHIVRLSDINIANGAFNVRNTVRNILNSMEVKWRDIGEKTLRFYESEDLKYTIIRIPTNLVQDSNKLSDKVILTTQDQGRLSHREIDVGTVASICAACASESLAENVTFSCATAEEGEEDAMSLDVALKALQNLPPEDPMELVGLEPYAIIVNTIFTVSFVAAFKLGLDSGFINRYWILRLPYLTLAYTLLVQAFREGDFDKFIFESEGKTQEGK